ncbi:transcription factor EC [Anabrus simplex]|uniref:transcription factor EC n=1 Tax=Anabrus simplex TaxID=316456 RepID=UPI0034DD3ADE
MNMFESGIDMGFDLDNLTTEDIELGLDFGKFEQEQTLHSQQFYELKSKTVPESPPTFKTATPTSRTQLKLQLMREQQQEQERREAELRQRQEQRPPTMPTVRKMPVNIQNIVPPHVFQVKTVLENPTLYHVIQKQKNQVRQYLSESFQQPHSADGIGARLSALQSELSQSTPQPPPQPQPMNVVPASPENALSASLSSVTTTSTSGAEELMEDLLSIGSFASDSAKITDQTFNISSDIQVGAAANLYDHLVALGNGDVTKTSNSCPPDLPQIKPEPLQLTEAELHALAKDRQKKDNHNMIERRRRFNINDRIKELGTLLPKNNDPYYEIVRDVRPNKGTILKSSVDYIKVLKNEVQRMKLSEARQKQLEAQNRRLLLRIQELELQAKAHGLPVSEFTWQPTTSKMVINNYVKNSHILHDPRRKMPDVVTEAATLSASQVEDLMDDDHPVNGDPMLSSPHIPSPTDHHIDEDDDDIDEEDSLVGDIDMTLSGRPGT